MKMKTTAVVCLLLLAAVCFGTKQKPRSDSDVLLQLEADFAADVAKHGHDAFLNYFADDGVEVVDGGGSRPKTTCAKKNPGPKARF